MTRTLTEHDKELLASYQKDIEAGSNRARKNHSLSIGQLWPYLARTPGEQLSLSAFGEIFGIVATSASSRLNGLVKHGLIRKATSRKGVGGGIGYLCDWLEQRRGSNGGPIEPTGYASVHASGNGSPVDPTGDASSNGNGTTRLNGASRHDEAAPLELTTIELTAEYVCQIVRPLLEQNSRMGIEIVDAMRKIQSSANRARLRIQPIKSK
jgi:hypothetical protein